MSCSVSFSSVDLFLTCYYTLEAPDVEEKCKLQAIHSSLSQQACCLWFSWHVKLADVITSTSKYGVVSEDVDEDLLSQWRNLIGKCSDEWARLVGLPAVTTTAVGSDETDSEEESEFGDADAEEIYEL